MGKLVREAQRYYESCGDGVYRPNSVDIVEKGRVLTLGLDQDLLNVDMELGHRRATVSSKLVQSEAWRLFREIALIYDRNEFILRTDSGYRMLERRGARKATLLGDTTFQVGIDFMGALAEDGSMDEAKTTSGNLGKFTMDYLTIEEGNNSPLTIVRKVGKVPGSQSGSGEPYVFIVKNTHVGRAGHVVDHLTQLEDAIERWKVKGDDQIGNVTRLSDF